MRNEDCVRDRRWIWLAIYCAGNAHGERLPPFILYKGKNLYQRWMQGGPAGAFYGISESGWMDASNFLSWFHKLFLPAVSHLTKTEPVVLFCDGHYSHISLELIREASANKVVLMCLPPNTRRLLQPLDVAVFAPLKMHGELETRGEHASKEEFPSLIAKLWDTSFLPKHYIHHYRWISCSRSCPLLSTACTAEYSAIDCIRTRP